MRMKKIFRFETRTLVATGLGSAIFMLLFMFVRIPSPIPGTSFQTAYGLLGMFGAIFGPLSGFLIAFIGHALGDAIQYGSPWWSWVIASGISGFIFGLSMNSVRADEGIFTFRDILFFNLFQIGGNLLAWLGIAPVLDVLIYAEPANLVFTQGLVAALMNIISTGVLGSLLLFSYSKTRVKKSSLFVEEE